MALTRRWAGVGLAAVLVLTAVLYAPGLTAYFVADDFRHLELASQIRGLGDWLPQIPGYCTRVVRPATTLLFWVASQMSGLQPEAYRLIALALHLANAVLVFLLVRRAGGSHAPALIAALVLALHPRQNESVMWLSALSWVAATGLSLIGAYCYVAWRQTSRLLWLAGVFAAVALAMLCNPSTIVLPVIFIGYDILQRNTRGPISPKRSDLWRWWAPSIGVWVGLLAVVGALGTVCGVGGLPNSGDSASYGLQLSGISHLGLFLVYTLWPVPLNLKDMLATTPLTAYAGVGLVIIVLAAAGLTIVVKGSALARWGLTWAVLALLAPASFSAYTSDHYMSLMLVGVALASAGIVQSLPVRWTRAALAIAALWVVFVTPQIMIKVNDWRAAGQITATVRDETLTRYPQVPDRTHFFYVGLPDTVNRATVWSLGIDSAVRVWYNNSTLRARRDVEFGVTNTPTQKEVIIDLSGRW